MTGRRDGPLLNRSNPDVAAAIGPRVRTSPFFDQTVVAGLSAVSTYNHMWLPMSYGDPEAEYERLTEGVSMWDVAAQRHIEVSGPDALDLVQYTTVIDVETVAPGSGAYAPMTDHRGVLINDPVLLRFEDGTWRFSIADADVRLWLAAVSAEREMDAEVTELETATLAIQGPRAVDVLADLGVPGIGEMEHFQRCPAVIGRVDVVVSRSGWSTQGGAELFIERAIDAPAVWDAVAAAGATHGIGPGAPNAQERIESVLLSYGTDTGYGASPLELGMEDLICFDGPTFVGKRALERERVDGPARRLVGAVLDGPPMDTLPHPVPTVGGVEGQLRAGAFSPRFGRNLGLALVDAGTADNARFDVETPDVSRGGRVVSLPFDESLG